MRDNQIEPELLVILQKYIDEYALDSAIDELRLREQELKIPGIKGKWASYRAVNKAKLARLKYDRDILLEKGVEMVYDAKQKQGDPITKKGAEYIVKKSEKYLNLDKKITNLTILCEYFDDCLKNMQSITFDLKNLIDTIKIDEL